MGARADFYIGRGKQAEWIGSIAWDGYLDCIDEDVLRCTTPESFKEEVLSFFGDRKDVTLPDQGWPWPWKDSCTTGCAYVIDNGEVYYSSFGGGWMNALAAAKATADEFEALSEMAKASSNEFPDMSEIENVALDERSGRIITSWTAI